MASPIVYGSLLMVFGMLFYHFKHRRSVVYKPLKPSEYGEWSVITGASSGLGVHFAKYLASKGFSIVLVARRAEVLASLAEEIVKKYGVNVKVVAVDLASEKGVQKIVEDTERLNIGILVNNAGFGYTGAFASQDKKKLAELVNLNCVAPMMLMSSFLPKFKEQGKGAIINISSVSGLMPLPYHSTYAASKAFLSTLSAGLNEELKSSGIDVLTVEPGTIGNTDFRSVSGASRTQSESKTGVVTSEQVVNETFQALSLRLKQGGLVSPSIIPGSAFVRLRTRGAVIIMNLFGDTGRRFVAKMAATRMLKLIKL